MTVETPRLRLIPLDEPMLDDIIAGDLPALAGRLNLANVPGFDTTARVFELRRDQLREAPSRLPWLLRTMVLRDARELVGYLGFHAEPGAEYLQALSPGAVEIGYTVFPAYRRRGYAREAVTALIRWAFGAQRVPAVIASVAPDNAPSLAMVHALGFRRIASHMDPDDGLEDIYELKCTDEHKAETHGN